MNCYILAGGEEDKKVGSSSLLRRAKLEKSFRNYAAVFDKVKLVIKEKQAKEDYLNFPHICDENETSHSSARISRALQDADSDAVFIGSADIYDFPISLLSKLIKEYNGELFLGYVSPQSDGNSQPLFGIYHKKMADKISNQSDGFYSINTLTNTDAKFLILPDEVDSSCIGL